MIEQIIVSKANTIDIQRADLDDGLIYLQDHSGTLYFLTQNGKSFLFTPNPHDAEDNNNFCHTTEFSETIIEAMENYLGLC